MYIFLIQDKNYLLFFSLNYYSKQLLNVIIKEVCINKVIWL
ncbi:hypothetical protein ECH_0182 [Ehrlichia chaffeensis str. Arkansas]|uniref:Uncharacterized protein n=1 Tax=Ehrlichia chaffeensis (strain ATCC CRL-10679 / Arkansas) TaxID=205920 RepID=Q2GHS6_EHRCR|nr:hypothetical protein ECH_0182 [Ehrlichia chaffeensis str. Arkansas]